MTLSPKRLGLACSLFYLAIVVLLLVKVVRLNEGHVIYALDDPYIHLALAENLAHGHYGINSAEASSPSSSILWPFLLTPFSGTKFHAYLPLLYNVFFGLFAAYLIGYFVATWPPQQDRRGKMSWEKQLITGFLLVFCANLAGLTWLGMEHVLQVAIAICCAIGIAEALDKRPIPLYCLYAAAIGPSLRYEDLGLTLAICCALVAQQRWARAIGLLCLSVSPLVGFSLYLRHLGLPALPLSVLVKGQAYGGGGSSHRIISMLYGNIIASLTNVERLPIVVLIVICARLSWTAKDKSQRLIFAGASATGLLHVLIGRFGWAHRYEVYVLIFLILICMRILSAQPRFLFGYFALGLTCCASTYIRGTVEIPNATHDIYDQQYQMHRFVTEFYSGNYAVNDIGLTSFQHRPGSYLLDLYGLSSLEASLHADRPTSWIADVTKRYDTHLAILYADFQLPPEWTPLARMCIRRPPVYLAFECVTFYSTAPQYDLIISRNLVDFSRTLPADVEIDFARARHVDSMWLPDRELP